ncbi:MAG: HAMP domain-containing histidine kinase, partial [Acidimicrobiia bacterium]|nr:HAMP domain-containing histidine kinase [Acidimicrobiia bacterium]
VLVASRSMFVSNHDLDVLVVVIAASATVGVLAAMVLGERVGRATRSLTEITRRIGAHEAGTGSAVPAPEEFTRLARELADMERRLSDAQAAREELVAWVSHDLRTPMAGIRALVEALEDGVADDPATVERYHRTLREQTDRLASLVDDLFELSRLNAGAVELTVAPMSLGDLVSDAVASVSHRFEAKGVAVRAEPGPRAPVHDVAARELGRVIQNLLDNAVRHTPRGGTVTVQVGASGPWSLISVEDTGGGIPAGELEHIFEPGYTGDRARTPDDDAAQTRSGLGLAIAAGFVALHGGTLTAENVDRGARFEIRLPRREAGRAAAHSAPEPDGARDDDVSV